MGRCEPLIEIRVDEEEIKKLYIKAIEEKLKKLDVELVFWDTKELKRRTCLSWNTIQDNFFHDKDFPKAKIGGKWMYPAKETEEFLLEWMKGKRC